MTVQELIEALQKQDPNAGVYVDWYNGGLEDLDGDLLDVQIYRDVLTARDCGPHQSVGAWDRKHEGIPKASVPGVILR